MRSGIKIIESIKKILEKIFKNFLPIKFFFQKFSALWFWLQNVLSTMKMAQKLAFCKTLDFYRKVNSCRNVFRTSNLVPKIRSSTMKFAKNRHFAGFLIFIDLGENKFFPHLKLVAKIRSSTMKIAKNRHFAGFLIFTVKCISAEKCLDTIFDIMTLTLEPKNGQISCDSLKFRDLNYSRISLKCRNLLDKFTLGRIVSCSNA